MGDFDHRQPALSAGRVRLLLGLLAAIGVGQGTALGQEADGDLSEKSGSFAVRVDLIAATDTQLAVDLAVVNLIDAATEGLLERGIPVTVVYEIELWRERPAWFDRLESRSLLAFKLKLDVWDEVYVIADAAGREEIFVDLAEARTALERRHGVPIAPLSVLKEGDRYYLSLSAAVKPLTVEDVDELEGWLSGEIRSGRRRGIGVLGLPKALFGLVMNLTGFKDRNASLRTQTFGRTELLRMDDGSD